MGKRKISLRSGLVIAILICWLMPILFIVTLSGVLLNSNYQNAIRQQIQSEAASALTQVQMNLADAIWDSKAVSYDGIVRSAFRAYAQDGDSAQLYRTVNDYMTQNFSRESRYRAAFLYFWGEGEDANAYVLCRGTTGHDLLAQVKQTAPWIVDAMQDADTAIRFYNLDGELYMARNILNSHFESYATIAVLLDSSVVLQSMEGIQRVSSLTLTVDDCMLTQIDNGTQPGSDTEIRYTVDADGHKITLSAFPEAYDLWQDTPWLRWAVVGVALMVLPLLLVMIALFHRHVSFPMETLAEANGQIQAGQRGYQIEKTAPNAEFERLYANFNVMSTELKNQFERSYQEQRAAQKAQIKALQSQINPHFLNNTLEIISWEARLADNERVCAMIEALSMDCIRTARAKGVREKVVIYSHAWRNALLPVVTLIIGWFLGIFGGSVMIENIFGLNGFGKTYFDALNGNDNEVILALQMFYVSISLFGNLLIDLVYGLVDPRVRVNK